VLRDGSLYRLKSACDEVQKCRFPGTVGAEDGYTRIHAVKGQKGGSQFGLERDGGLSAYSIPNESFW